MQDVSDSQWALLEWATIEQHKYHIIRCLHVKWIECIRHPKAPEVYVMNELRKHCQYLEAMRDAAKQECLRLDEAAANLFNVPLKDHPQIAHPSQDCSTYVKCKAFAAEWIRNNLKRPPPIKPKPTAEEENLKSLSSTELVPSTFTCFAENIKAWFAHAFNSASTDETISFESSSSSPTPAFDSLMTTDDQHSASSSKYQSSLSSPRHRHHSLVSESESSLAPSSNLQFSAQDESDCIQSRKGDTVSQYTDSKSPWDSPQKEDHDDDDDDDEPNFKAASTNQEIVPLLLHILD